MYTDYDLYMTLGELALTKVAGEIDNDTFDYYATAIVKQADELVSPNQKNAPIMGHKKTLGEKASRALGKAKSWIADAAKANDIRAGWKGVDGKKAWGQIAKGVGKTGLVYGAPVAALGGGYYLTHKKGK